MSAPWETSPKATFGNDLDLKPHLGCTLLCLIGGYHAETPSKFENNSRISATVVVLDGPSAGTVLKGKIRNERPKRRFRSSGGKVHLGKLVSEVVAGNDTPDIAEMTPYDDSLAKGWSAYYPGRLDQLLAEAVATYAKDEADYRAELAQQNQPQPQASQNPNTWSSGAQAAQPQLQPNGGQQVQPSSPPPWGQQQAQPQPQFQQAAATPPPAPPAPVSQPAQAPWLTDQPPY